MKAFVRRGLVVFLLLVFPSFLVFAEDVLVLRNGDIINVVVKEITPSEIKYQKANNLNGPIYTISKADAISIKYANGETEKFDLKYSSATNKEHDGKTENALPASDNEEQKAKYSVLPQLNVKVSNKTAKRFFPIMAFTDSSVISTKDIMIAIVPNPVEYYDGGWKTKLGYCIQIYNKTDSPIYVDRSNCFRRFNNNETKSFYDNKTYTVTSGNSSGIGVGAAIGAVGLGIGNSSSSSSTETFGVDRFLVIGPKAKANLIDYKYIRLSESKAKFKTVADIEYWGFDLRSKEKVNQGGCKTYSEDETPYSNKYFIIYSTDPQFNTKATFSFELYARYIVGAEIKQWRWAMMNPVGRMVEEVQQIIPDFGITSSVIIGMNGEYIK